MSHPPSRLHLPAHPGLSGLHAPVQDQVDALSDDERQAVCKAVDKRRHEYATGRWLAHQALADLGVGVDSIPTGPDREPIWPSDVKGSITHTDGHAAVAVSADPMVAGVGIDMECMGRVGDSILRRILTDKERARQDEVDPTLLFSAKESCFKVLFPIFRQYVEFQAVEVTLDQARHSFSVSYLGDHADHRVIEKARGSYQQVEGHWLTCVSLMTATD